MQRVRVIRPVSPIALIAVMALAACGGKSPTEPEPTPNLSLSATSVALARGETTQISATSLVAGGTRADVSQEATWISTNPAVVTAVAGTLTATGPGTAEIQVTYRGITQRVAVTARRNTALGGTITIRLVESGIARMNMVYLFIESKQVGGSGTEWPGGYYTLNIPFGWAPDMVARSRRSIFDITPGDYEMTVDLNQVWLPANSQPFSFYNDTGTSRAVLFDRDTDEILAPVVFPKREVTLTGPGKMTLPFSVPVFTN